MKTKSEALQAVAQFATNARVAIVGTSDGLKISGLTDKARDANTFLYNDADDPNEDILKAFTAECLERNLGETPEQLATVILYKANMMRMIRAKLDGLEDRMKTAINMAPTDELAVMTFHGARGLAVQELAKLGVDGSEF